MIPPIKDLETHTRLIEQVRRAILSINTDSASALVVTRAVVVRPQETVRVRFGTREVMKVAVKTEPRPGNLLGRIPGIRQAEESILRRRIAGDGGEIQVVDIRSVADDPEAGWWTNIDIEPEGAV